MSPQINITDFFDNIFYELYQSIYVFLGGSLDDGVINWAERGLAFLKIGIKCVILLLVIGFFYWLFVYFVKYLKNNVHLTHRQVWIIRAILRYAWIVISILAIMTQVGTKTSTITATAKGAIWAGFYYILWVNSGQILASILKHYELNASIEQLLKNMISVIIMVLALATILAQFGFDIVSLVAGLGIVGLAVGFAAQSTLANFIAGITILVEQSFQVGDWIRINNQEGRVVRISLRATQILDRDNIIIIIPNSTMSSSQVTNLTSKKMIRFDVKIKIALNADVNIARESILKALNKDEVILKHPMPMVTIGEVGEYALYLIVRFWVAPLSVARIPIIKEQIIEKIKNALHDADIEIPYPYMNVRFYEDLKDKERCMAKYQDGVN